MNQTIISGNLGRDAETRYTQSGTAVTNMSVAVSDRVKRQGEWVDETTWFRVAVFGKRAEGLAKCNLQKGQRVIVRGRVKLNEYEKRDGTMGASLELLADDVELVGSKREGGSQHSGNSHRQPRGGGGYDAPPPNPDDFPADDFGDDDIPF